MAAPRVRNPPWSREETLLALDLYFQLNSNIPTSKSGPKILELSELLRQNPLQRAFAIRPSFRNASSVAYKLQNINYAATGRGMPNNSRRDRALWAEYGERPAVVRELAASIREAIKASKDLVDFVEEVEPEFVEGRVLTGMHRYRERDSNLRKQVLKCRRKSGEIWCDSCSISFPHFDETLDSAAFEVHHLVPVSQAGPRSVRIADTALLCATCHRLIHALISQRKEWVNLESLKSIMRSR